MGQEDKQYNSVPSDEELLKKAKGGYKPAFDVFYNRNKRRILNYIYRMIGNFGYAEEIAQEAFVKAYIALPRYVEEGKPLSWIYAIAGNLAKNFLRDKQYKPRLLLDKDIPGKEGLTIRDVIPADVDTPLDIAVSREEELLVQKNIRQLPIKFREVLILCDIQGCSYEEAAGILKCKVGSVGSRLSKARSLLAERLKKYFSKSAKGKKKRE